MDNIKADRSRRTFSSKCWSTGALTWRCRFRRRDIAGKKVFFVDTNALVACFDAGVTEDVVKEIARRKPLRAVFRDDVSSRSVKINVEQIFRLLSPDTEVRSISGDEAQIQGPALPDRSRQSRRGLFRWPADADRHGYRIDPGRRRTGSRRISRRTRV